MKITDTYSKLSASRSVADAHAVFRDWNYTDAEIREWFERSSTAEMQQTAQAYLREVSQIVQRVESFFKTSLIGELVLIPSMGEVDGFARYDRGHHTVMLGIDFPGASIDYLRALTAHELSHVVRDHSPKVWGFLNKPLQDVSREEYLEATTGREHLISEGLATLTSQQIYPEVKLHDHHYYEPEEMQWCLDNDSKIDEALRTCLSGRDPDPWRFYRPGSAGRGSPSRTHYYWSARKLDEWIRATRGMNLVHAHSLAEAEIGAF